MKLFLTPSLVLHIQEDNMSIPSYSTVVHVWIRRGAAAPPLVRTALVRGGGLAFSPHHIIIVVQRRREYQRARARETVAQGVQKD